MSMAIKGLYSSDWLYTQTPLPRISFLQPWHCWHHSLTLSIAAERERGRAQKSQGKMLSCETATEYQGRKEKRSVWHFQPPGVFMFRSFGYDLKWCGADAHTPKEAISRGGSRAHVKVIMKAVFCSFKYKLAKCSISFHCPGFNYLCFTLW